MIKERFCAGVGLAAPPKPTARARSGPLRGLEAVRGAEGGAGCFTTKFLAGCVLCRAAVWRTGLLGGLAARVFGHGKAAPHQVGRSPSSWKPPFHIPFSPSQGMLDEIGDPKRGGGPLPAPTALPHPGGLILFAAAPQTSVYCALILPVSDAARADELLGSREPLSVCLSPWIEAGLPRSQPKSQTSSGEGGGGSRPEILKPNLGLWDRCGF